MRKVIVFFSLLLMATMSIASVQKSDDEIPLQVEILDPTIPHGMAEGCICGQGECR